MLNIRSAAVRALSTTVLLGMAGIACAQDDPAKPIRFIAPNLPGGPTDILARLLAQKLSEAWGQPVVVENRAGAGGNIATEYVARAPADGYTMITGNNATFAANVTLYKKLPFDPVKDFAPVVLVATQPNILVVHPSLPVRSVKELIAFAKAHPGELNYGNSGIGAAAHLSAELFKSMTGTKIESIPYKSAAPALTDLIAGQCQLMFATSLSVQQHIESKKLRALAVTTAKRIRSFPNLPTIAEAGVPGFEATTWHGVLVPAKTPTAIVTKMNAEINRILRMPDVRERLAGMGAEVLGGTPKQFADHIQREIPKWAKVIRDAHVTIE